jgi:tripartite-type tricarboxylate transporter receptor subunit TctC
MQQRAFTLSPARRFFKIIRSVVVVFALPSAAMASGAYPTKPINMVVSYPAGGSVDVAARIYQDQLSKLLGQTIVVENKGGAGGTIATNAVARAQPDGYTLLMTLSSHTINPAIYSSLSFDTEADFKPVSLVASAPQVLVAHPSFGPSNLQELIDHVKKSDAGVPYGTAGTGSPSHIAGELFKQMGGDLNLMHVPYRGGGPATIDVVSGQIPLLWVSLPSVTSFIKNGKLKALAVSTDKRTPVMPDIPSAAETLPGFNVDSWYAVFAPANTPDAVVNRLYEAFAQASKEKTVQNSLMAQGAVAVGSTPAELGDIVKREVAMWKDLATKAQIKVD